MVMGRVQKRGEAGHIAIGTGFRRVAGIALALILMTLSTAHAQGDPGGATTTFAPETSTVLPDAVLLGSNVLVVRDGLAWGKDALGSALSALGVSADRIPTSQLGTVDLSRYRMVIMASAQSQSYYTNFAAQRSRLEAWVTSGGVLMASLTDGACTLPGGVSCTYRLSASAPVSNWLHPITQGLASPITGSFASHGALTGVPVGAESLVVESEFSPSPSLVIYRMGSGMVLASAMTEQYYYAPGGTGLAGLLTRMLQYSLGLVTQVVTVTSGPNGSVSPSGDVSVIRGGSIGFTITPDTGYRIADVLVDGVSVGPVTAYTFNAVTANHTLSATFTRVTQVIAISPMDAITPARPVVRVPVLLRRSDRTPIAAFSIGIEVHGLSVNPSAIRLGRFLGTDGASASLFVRDLGAGRYLVDAATLGTPCGSSALEDTLFTVEVGAGVAGNDAGVLIPSADLRDCLNRNVPVLIGDSASVHIAREITALTQLAAAQARTGNDRDGTTRIGLTWPAVATGLTVEVWRKGFGNYPQYDEGATPGSVPTVPASYPPAGWTKTTVTASGQADEPATRDFWYFVAYVKDAYGTVSPVSNMTAGTLNYHLGDFSNGVTPGSGDNLVNTLDTSLLGAHYGLTGAAVAAFPYLDVGPTTDRSVNARPTTDNVIGFDDLIMLGFNYAPVVSSPTAHARPAAATSDAVTLAVANGVPVGDELTARIDYAGTGRMQGLSVALAWDPAVVEPVGHTAGEGLLAQDVVLLSAAPGSVDAVSFAGTGNGLVGEGVFATMRFRVKAAGEPRIGLASVEARDRDNRSFTPLATLSAPGGGPRTYTTTFAPVTPNPFTERTRFDYTLARAGQAALQVYSVDGRRVRTLVSRLHEAGAYTLEWDGRDDAGRAVREGVYFARLVTPQTTLTRTVTFLK